MKLSKLDLSNLIAIAHSGGNLQLFLDLGDELEFLEIPSPVEVFEGLQHLNEILTKARPKPSSMVNAMGYDGYNELLQVEFYNDGIYQYAEVPDDTWEDLNQADSIGRFFNNDIRGKYHYEGIDDDYSC